MRQAQITNQALAKPLATARLELRAAVRRLAKARDTMCAAEKWHVPVPEIAAALLAAEQALRILDDSAAEG